MSGVIEQYITENTKNVLKKDEKLLMERFILILTFLLLIPQTGYTSGDVFEEIIEEILPTSQLTSSQLKTLKKEMAIQKIFIEGVKKIELRGGEFVNIEKSTNTLRDLFIDSMNAKQSSLTGEALDQITDITKEGFNKNALKNVLTKTRDFAYSFGKSRKIFASSLTRRFGFDVAMVYFASSQVNFTFPLTMMAQGNFSYSALMGAPISSVTTGSYVAIKSAVKYRQVIKSLGGLVKASEHLRVYKKMKSYFNQTLFKKYDLFDMRINNTTYAFTTQKRNLLNRALTKLGWNSSAMNYENLVRYMDEKRILPKVVNSIKDSNRSPEAKLIRLLVKIEQTDDSNIIHEIRKKFGKYINEISDLPEFSSQRKWVMRIMDSRTFDDFMRQLNVMPNDIPPAIFDAIWRQKIIIGNSKSIVHYTGKQEYIAFRKLIKDYDRDLRGRFANSLDTEISPYLKGKFTDYIYNSLGNIGACQNALRPKKPNTVPFL